MKSGCSIFFFFLTSESVVGTKHPNVVTLVIQEFSVSTKGGVRQSAWRKWQQSGEGDVQRTATVQVPFPQVLT